MGGFLEIRLAAPLQLIALALQLVALVRKRVPFAAHLGHRVEQVRMTACDLKLPPRFVGLTPDLGDPVQLAAERPDDLFVSLVGLLELAIGRGDLLLNTGALGFQSFGLRDGLLPMPPFLQQLDGILQILHGLASILQRPGNRVGLGRLFVGHEPHQCIAVHLELPSLVSDALDQKKWTNS